MRKDDAVELFRPEKTVIVEVAEDGDAFVGRIDVDDLDRGHARTESVRESGVSDLQNVTGNVQPVLIEERIE